MKFLIYVIVLLSVVSFNAHAYLDPGSGSMFLYALIGILSTLLYAFKNVYYKIVLFFSGKKISIGTDMQDVNIIFHSEGGKYWHVFASVIEELDKRNIKIAYISPDPDDPALAYASENVIVKIVPSSMQAYMYMKQVKVPVVVSTTPQLDVYMFTRSKHVSHYAHIIHAPTDVYLYKKFSFDFYDSILCSGPHQIQHLRDIEDKRNTARKRLFETGCTYYDISAPVSHLNFQRKISHDKKITVLFAPTWGEASILTKYEYTLFEILFGDPDIAIIFRPHPQMKISQSQLYDRITSSLSQHSCVSIDEERENTKAIQQADVLLSDISGIIFDFAFLQQKPVVTIQENTMYSEKGYDGEGLIPFQEVWEYTQRNVLGPTVAEQDMHMLPRIIRDTIVNSSTYTKNIHKLRESSVYNFGSAGKVAADQLQGILKELS